MFRRAILASDFSRESMALVNCSGGLKAFGTEEILLLHFWGSMAVLEVDSFYKPAVYEDFSRNLQKQQSILEEQGFKVETRVLEGLSASQVNKIAIDENYSLIGVGSGRDIFSPMANELIHSAQRPTYIYKSSEIKAAKAPCVQGKSEGIADHVLFATDFSKNSEVAFNYLIQMIPLINRKISIIHIQDEYRISPYLDDKIDEFNRIDSARLEGMKKLLLDKGCPETEAILKYGPPASEILKSAEELSVQMVVMGNQGRGFVNEFFLGSVSHNVARQSPVSVLLIPAKRN
ncbi:MAG: universal stress protein [Synergistaceae bacterium]|nr:universal stress protein [Synergistaceae bacterium]